MQRIGVLFLVLAAACGGGTGRPSGPPPPVLDTIRTYEGHVGYYVTGPNFTLDASGRLIPEIGFNRPNVPRSGPRFTVEILGPTDELLGATTTDEKGNYTVTVNFGPNPAKPARVRVVAHARLSGGTDLRVLPNLASPGPYELISAPTTDLQARTTKIDLDIQLVQGAAAFHIIEVLFSGMSAIRGAVSGPLPDLDVFWEPGNGPQSSFTVADALLGRLVVAGGTTGDDASNQDAWDDPQLMRLLGEYFLAYFSNSVSPAGTVDNSLLVPSAAWREGFLDFWACAARGTPEFWDTEGIGSAGRIVRYFNAESFFDPALGSLGPDDANVYQDPTVIGIGSRFTTTELLWDIYDGPGLDADNDGLSVPLFLLIGDLSALRPGNSYPYLYSALDEYVANLSFSGVQAEILLSYPEAHDLHYPAAGTTVWPTPVTDATRLDGTIVPPYDEKFPDSIDNSTPGVNPEIGLSAQRYFSIRVAAQSTITASVTSAASLRVEILDLKNKVIAGGTGSATTSTPGGDFVVRVLPAIGQVSAPFELRIKLDP